ncbi:glutaredoxin family protein [Yinghuangia soli]|uniref:Glutaredoxin family protein n=1 Tax=Yinghuangia soli TaxID=2908204 RepID=A0AA41TZ38_9ACTN|nr:glutaredoxin family protein [Yinghuangia soli]MCF2528433.1 glutaredoxin family protein [Yinghuangia soli]
MSLFRRRSAATPQGPSAQLVTMLSRPGCHLCDDARAVIVRVTAELGVAFEEVDITTDPELEEEYREQIPVTFVDGRQHDFWRVDERRLRAALA